MTPGFYWIEILEGPYAGPEVARLAGDLFFTTRFDGCGECIACAPECVRVLAGPLPEPTPAAPQ